MISLSPRQIIAQNFAVRLGVEMQRVEHGSGSRSMGNRGKRKHYYLIVGPEPKNHVIEVFGEKFIVVNGHFCKSMQEAEVQFQKAVKTK